MTEDKMHWPASQSPLIVIRMEATERTKGNERSDCIGCIAVLGSLSGHFQ
jgi:hypothetical protein